MGIYLGLGSNLGDRRALLARALELLEHRPLSVSRVSPVVESPALLPEGAPPEWNRPFLNLAAHCETQASPDAVHGWIEEIQQELGRKEGPRWSPRPIDIDVLLWEREQITTDTLTIPHIDIRGRNFVLTPLIALEPKLTLPGLPGKTVLDWSRDLPHHLPLWMGILNVTPDSFSDGGRFMGWDRVAPHVDAMIQAGAHIIDIGGESTRPGATPLPPEEEWRRVGPILSKLLDERAAAVLGPLISIDTYHPETARRALALGVDIINDVSGLSSPEMIELAGESGADWVAMHQLSLPADPKLTLPADGDPYDAVEAWLLERIPAWERAGLDLNRIIFDPGIGFGKSAQQSLTLLRRAGEFRKHGLRVLVGHSRKSFLNAAAGDGIDARDLATAEVSKDLCAQGVDILRVHNVPMHVEAFRGS